LLAELRSRRISVRVAVMSGDNSEDVLYRVAAAGAEAFFDKPIAVEDVVEWIERPVAAA
jgi:DNA-binding NarL/FixJ family response regulator